MKKKQQQNIGIKTKIKCLVPNVCIQKLDISKETFKKITNHTASDGKKFIRSEEKRQVRNIHEMFGARMRIGHLVRAIWADSPVCKVWNEEEESLVDCSGECRRKTGGGGGEALSPDVIATNVLLWA